MASRPANRQPPGRRSAALWLLLTAAAALLYVWLVQSMEVTRTRLNASVTSLREQASRLERQATEYERTARAPAISRESGDLAARVRAQTAAVGLVRSLSNVEAMEAGRVRMSFGAVNFSDWLALVARLHALGIRLETCRVEAMSRPGMVSVNATFARAGAP
jgi:type II secretory pathway component PulM